MVGGKIMHRVLPVFILSCLLLSGCVQADKDKSAVKEETASDDQGGTVIEIKDDTPDMITAGEEESLAEDEEENSVSGNDIPSYRGYIAIDAGHQQRGNSQKEPLGPGSSEMKAKVTGGTSGVSSGLHEYELNLQVALKLRDELEERGYRVLMIRESNDVDISNAERAAMANEAGVDALIRIHANGSENSSANGIMTICQTPSNPYNASIYKLSRLLSEEVLNAAAEATGARKEKVWETDSMTGINWSEVPVTIIEMGYMTNAAEDMRMASEDYQIKMAGGIADGIDRFMEKSDREDTSPEARAEEILSGMTLEEKIYQMIILTPEQLTGVEKVTAAGDTTRKSLEKYPVGGLVYFADNLKDPKQTKEMLSKTAEYSRELTDIPLFLCIDEEGGRVLRIGGNPAFGVNKTVPMCEIKSEKEAKEAGRYIGSYLSELGFNVDFAPDSDVLTNPDNKVIGERSFGDDPVKVSTYSKAYLEGLHESGVMGTYKHFPGHGATVGDTHEERAYTDKTLKELKDAELVPFAGAKDAGADMVMVSHISLPKVLDDHTPCSLSKQMITDVLKGQLEYDGIVITDSMRMKAVSGEYDAVTAAAEAIKAGNDMLLMTEGFRQLPEKIQEEIDKGEIGIEQIDESVRKILIKKLTIKE